MRHHSVLKIAACSGAVTAALWSWQAISAADNQAKIEEKLATVAETVRTARIYTKREK